MTVSFKLNGRSVSWDCAEGETLLSALRRKGFVSVRDGCDGEGTCGLCAVILDGRTVNSCTLLAAQAADREVYTTEFFSRDRRLSVVQQALIDAACVQCGYCTPAVVLAVHALLERSPEPDKAEVRDALAGTLCRCTGYEQFFNAVRIASKRLAYPNYAEPAARVPARPAPVGKIGRRWTRRPCARRESLLEDGSIRRLPPPYALESAAHA
jgi:aerobic-type carbon monoxide dehydrogenase small subunit (CoxS/CutS family)